jgi:hypothetical protein
MARQRNLSTCIGGTPNLGTPPDGQRTSVRRPPVSYKAVRRQKASYDSK